METAYETDQEDNNRKKRISKIIDDFVCHLFIPNEIKYQFRNSIPTPPRPDISKKKMIKNKSIGGKFDLTNQNYTKSKPVSYSHQKRNLNISGDKIPINSSQVNYEEVTQTEKEMKLYLKRVEAFNNRINALKKQESELSNRMVIMEKKEKTIEQIKNNKKKLKDVLTKNKSELNKEKESRKDQVMMKKINHQEKFDQIKKDCEQKKRQNIEISKAGHTLVKSMISQTNTKTETMNKYKYLQVKEGYAQFKADEQIKTIEKEEQKKEQYIKKIIEDKERIQKLKEKCDELERIEEECFEKLKTTKNKSNYFQFKIESTYSLANKIKNETINHMNNTIHVNQTASLKQNSNEQLTDLSTKNEPIASKSQMIPNNNMIVKVKKNSLVGKQSINKSKINRPQSSKAKTKNLNECNYSSYKPPIKPMISHKRNKTEINPLLVENIKFSTII